MNIEEATQKALLGKLTEAKATYSTSLNCNEATLENITDAIVMSYPAVDAIIDDVVCNQFGLSKSVADSITLQVENITYEFISSSSNSKELIATIDNDNVTDEQFVDIINAVAENLIETFEDDTEDDITSSKLQLAEQIEWEFLHELKEDNITISSEEDFEKVVAKFVSEAAIDYEMENDEEIIFWIDLISLDPLKIKVNVDNA